MEWAPGWYLGQRMDGMRRGGIGTRVVLGAESGWYEDGWNGYHRVHVIVSEGCEKRGWVSVWYLEQRVDIVRIGGAGIRHAGSREWRCEEVIIGIRGTLVNFNAAQIYNLLP